MNEYLYYQPQSAFGAVLAFGEGPVLSAFTSWDAVDAFVDAHKEKTIVSAWSYDLKNRIENVKSLQDDALSFPELLLWVPACVFVKKDATWEQVQGEQSVEHHHFLKEYLSRFEVVEPLPALQWHCVTTKANYIQDVKALKAHIQRGDVYELNYCIAHEATLPSFVNGPSIFAALHAETSAPYACYWRHNEFEVCCFSPENYLVKQGSRLNSSPIKGTIARETDVTLDKAAKERLYRDQKERSENVMITDLVRNDLSRIAQKDSVRVDELFGVHTFKTVHHLISTISCAVRPEVTLSAILRASFPMGSMTGAPKIAAMELIEAHETFKRGWYSGAIGVFHPRRNAAHDFDLNVVIRTVLFNHAKQKALCAVGSAITALCDAEREWEECQVKVAKILRGFEGA